MKVIEYGENGRRRERAKRKGYAEDDGERERES